MRCTWSTSANVLLRRAIHAYNKPVQQWHEPRRTLRTDSRTKPFQPTRLPALQNPCIHTSIGKPLVSFIPYNTLTNSSKSPPDESQVETEQPTNQLTCAQLSRAAAQAVRLSIDDRELKNAYFIVNSLRLSVLRENKTIERLPGLRSQIQRFDPINFHQVVSPRLSAHALLHGLIRLGLTVKASKQADLMIRDGIRIRSASLHATIHTLLAHSSSSPAATCQPTQPDIGQTHNGRKVLNLDLKLISDPCTRYAVRLFLHGRMYQQRRSNNMYQSLINACLLQGEIIVGSLLLAMVVKDWQLRRTLAARLSEESEFPADHHGHSKVDLRPRLAHLRGGDIDSQQQSMYAILSSIDATLSDNPHRDSDQTKFHASLQALANLAMLLDNRQIPFPQIAPLIRALYRCPRVDHHVWIYKDGIPRRVKALPYFHGVLKRLIGSLPSKPPSIESIRSGSMLPPLDLHAYNSLLHYALRHRYSPAIANDLIEHMRTKRWKPLEPDISTYNVLLRSGTLLRRRDITDQTLEILRRKTTNDRIIGESSAETSMDENLVRLASVRPLKTSRFSKALYRLGTEKIQIRSGAYSTDTPPAASLKADSFTLSSYIAHLTSTGQPQVVAHVLFRVLPELAIIDHPSWGSLAAEDRQKLGTLSRRACIRRAVAHGPYFFTAVLNALCKAGKTGLMERVWHLAKEAERVSWIPKFMPKSGPWCLPVHAYTSMVQRYVAEARAGLKPLRVGGRPLWLASEGGSDWVPKSKRYVRGWAKFFVSRNRIARSDGSFSGRQIGMILFHSMKSGAQAVYESLLKVKHLNKGQWRNVQIPSPDARFFNAALELCSQRPYLSIRGHRAGRAYWRHRLRGATVRYARRGKLSNQWTPLLQDIAQEMIDAGYPIPPALRHLFVGRWIRGTLQSNDQQQLDRRPFSFPLVRHGTLHPCYTPAFKTRGRPMRRRQHRRSPPKTLPDVALASKCN